MIGGLVIDAVAGAVLAGCAFVAGRASALRGSAGARHAEAAAPVDDRFERLAAELPIAAILLDRRGLVRLANAAATEVFEFGGDSVEGLALIEAIPSIELERIALAALRGERVSREVNFSLQGRERALHVRAYPAESGDGATVLAVDRTRVIALERVRQDFISNVSHELRTPLSAIKLMVETVIMSEGDPEASQLFLPQVNREVDRMVQLVEDLLELARSESGRLRLRREELELGAFAESVVTTVIRRAEAAGVELAVEASEPVYVDADRNRLTQVLVNLLDNALRHTPAGGKIAVRVGVDGDEAQLSVRDSGAGIPYRDLPYIFERFYVVERSRNRERTGMGLGLSIVKQLVEAHDGRISAESELGRGATFVCRLPRLTASRHVSNV